MYSATSSAHNASGGGVALPIPGTTTVTGFTYAARPGPSNGQSTSASSLSSASFRNARSWKSIAAFLAVAVAVVLVIALAYVYWRRSRLAATSKRNALHEAFAKASAAGEAKSTVGSEAGNAATATGSAREETAAAAGQTREQHGPSAESPVTGSAESSKRYDVEMMQKQYEQAAAGTGGEGSSEHSHDNLSVRRTRQVSETHELEWERAEREALRHEQSRLRGLKRQLIARKAELKQRGGFRAVFGSDDGAKRRWRDEQSRLLRELTEGRREYKRRSAALQQRRHQRRKRSFDHQQQLERSGVSSQPPLQQSALHERRRQRRSTAAVTDLSETSDYSSGLDDDDEDDAAAVYDYDGKTTAASLPPSPSKREREQRLLRNALSPLIAAPLTEPTVAENSRIGAGGYEEVAGLTTASLELEEPYTRHLDLRAARLAVYEKQTNDDPLPLDLRRYKLNGGKDTGVHSKWAKNERALLAMLSMLSQGLRHAYRYPHERLALTVTEDFVGRFKQAYESTHTNGQDTSSSSSVIVSRLPTHVTAQLLDALALYLLLPPRYTDRDSVRTASDLALAVAVTPTQYRYPTVRLSDAEAVRSLAAWLLATYRRHGGTFDVQVDASTDGAGLLADARFPLRQSEFEPGLHLDGGYFSRSRTPSFDMLRAASDPQLEYTFHLIRAEANPRVIWERVHRIASHRTIAVGLCGFNVPVQLAQPCNRLTLTNANSTNGIEVIPSCRYLRFFTQTMQFSVCGQASGKAYYDASLMDRRAPQYAVQYRNVHYSDSPSKFAFPANGLLNRLGDKELTNHDGRALDSVEYPNEAASFVAKWERYGVMYQAYRVEKLAPADVREIVLVDSLEERITIIAEITNLSPEETLVYHFTDRHRIEPGAKRCFKTQFEMTPNGREMTCTTGDSEFPGFPLRVDERFAVHVFHGPENGPFGDAVLMVDQQPRVCAPLSRAIEKAIVEVPMQDGRLATFAHHPAENQWLFSSYA